MFYCSAVFAELQGKKRLPGQALLYSHKIKLEIFKKYGKIMNSKGGVFLAAFIFNTNTSFLSGVIVLIVMVWLYKTWKKGVFDADSLSSDDGMDSVSTE